jgi:ubiquinone/menaquinone biosynthesis C-methylase UbiE
MSDYPTHPQFTAIAPHYDALMRGVPYRQWVRYLEQLLKSRNASPKRVLDLACGTGNVSEILAANGYDVTGVDIASGMIDAARHKAARKRLQIEYFVQDAAQLDLQPPGFDLCVSFFDSVNYILDPADLRSAIHKVFDHLVPGALFIFDINSEYALANHFFDQDNLYSNDRLRYVWRSSYDAESRRCAIRMRFFLRGGNGVDEEFLETHWQYAYREEELREMLAEAGFSAIETFHAYAMRPVSPTTDRIFFVAEKPLG